MAQAQYSDGVASASPDTSAPDDLQHIQSSPADFGGLVAEGADKLGAATSSTASFFGQVQTDDALNNAMGQANKLVEGFKSLNGADALRAQDSTNQQLDSAFKTARDGLGTPEQQYQFDQQARNYRERYIAGQVSAHATQQARVYTNKVTSDQADLADGHIAANAADPTEFANGAHDLRDALVKQAVNAYGGNQDDPNDPVVNDAIRRADQRATVTRIRALVPTDPMMAKQILDANKESLASTPAYDALSGQVAAASNRIAAAPAADNYLRRTGVAVTPTGPMMMPVSADGSVGGTPIGPDQIAAALHAQESGGAANAPTSVTGATGGWQIQPATFDQYAQPGERIDNPADNAAVGQRIVADLYKKAGGDPARVAVGYFSGSGNIAPPNSPTPWIQDKADPTGKSVSSYVQDVNSRLQKSNILIDKATGLAQIDQDYAANPQLGAAVRQRFLEQYTIASLTQQSQTLAQKAAVDQSKNGYVSEILKATGQGQAVDPSIITRIAQDPTLDAASKEQMGNFAEAHMRREVDKDEKTFGPGFWDAYKNVMAPQGADGRITDQDAIYNRAGPGGDLTLSGAEKLVGLMRGKGTPEGDADAQLQKQFFQTAKNQISGADDGLHIKDPKGDQLYLRFMTQAFPAIQAAKQAGQPSSQVYSPDGPIGALIKGFKRPPAEYMADMMSGFGGTAPGQPRDLKSIISDVQNGKLTSDQGKAEAQKLNLIAPDPAPVPTVPVMK